MPGLKDDMIAALQRQSDLIKQQVLLEIITIACNCEDFEQFKKVLYARALGMMKQFEDSGDLKPGTVEKAAKGEAITDDDIIKE